MGTKNLDVAIADAHPVVRAGVKVALSESNQVQQIAEFDNPDSLLESAKIAQWSVLILGTALLKGGGYSLLDSLLLLKPNLSVLVLSDLQDEYQALNALKAGAQGYINTYSSVENLIHAVLQVASGRRYISPQFAEILAEQALLGELNSLENLLSKRELQVFDLLVSGKGNNDIADLLDISNKTVSTYRSRILDKLNLKSTADLILYGIKNNLR